MYGWGTLYGVDSAPGEQTALQLDLRPVLALKARVALIRDVPKGEYTGYGRAFQTKRDSQLAVDITDAPGVAVGDIATLVVNRKDSRISAPRIAEQAGSISNELLSRMGNRLPIVIKE